MGRARQGLCFRCGRRNRKAERRAAGRSLEERSTHATKPDNGLQEGGAYFSQKGQAYCSEEIPADCSEESQAYCSQEDYAALSEEGHADFSEENQADFRRRDAGAD